MVNKEARGGLKEAQKKWEEGPLQQSLEEFGGREKEVRTYECPAEYIVKPLYTPLDENRDTYLEKLGFSGQYPFTRGIEPTMYRHKPWRICKYSGFGGGEDVNQRYKKIVASTEAPRLYLAVDLPTQLGYDSDDPRAEGEVGQVGVAVSSLKDIEDALDGIAIDKLGKLTTTAMANGPTFMSMFIALAEKRGLKLDQFFPAIQNDILKEYVARGAYIFPPKAGLKISVDVIEYCTKYMPSSEPIMITGSHFRESGATAPQEVAFCLADVIAYAEELVRRGGSIDAFGRQVWCLFSIHHDVLEEAAKFRAARRMWAKIMKERLGAKDPEAWKIKILAGNGGSGFTAQQPLNNIARITLQAYAAALGGVQDILTYSYDEALSIPSEEAMMVDIRGQQIIAYESGVCNTADPLGGSFYIESLTDQIEDAAWEYIKKIDSIGGALAAIEKGYMQTEIANSAYNLYQMLRSHERIQVGVNEFRMEEESPIQIFRVDPIWEKRQIEKVRKLKKERDNEKVKQALQRLREAAKSNENLMQSTLEAVKVYATVGEIHDILREVYGEYRAPAII